MRLRRGFTLLEMTVVGVIALTLMAVIAFGFLGVEKDTSAGHVETQLRQVSSSLRAYYESRGYFPTDATTLGTLEPGFTFTTGQVTEEGPVSIVAGVYGDTDVVALASLDASGQCVVLREGPNGAGVAPASSTFTPDSSKSCSASAAIGLP